MQTMQNTQTETIDLSVVVPCYNEEEVLPLFLNAVTDVVTKMGIRYELVFVDDGSKDNTLGLLKQYASQDPHVQYFSFSRNFGKEAGIFAGLKNARGQYVVLMDADLQDPPAYLPEMYTRLQSGEYDCVATRRGTRKGEPPVRSFFARAFYRMINRMTDTEIVDGARDFRMMSRKMVDSILEVEEYNRFSKGLFSWVGYRTYWISYENVERAAGKTKWSFWKLFKYAIEGIVNFSHSPLDVATGTGMIFTFFAFVWAFILILKRIIIGEYNVSGWTSTICVIIFLGGIQLLSIGILGQYIARIFTETKHRPIYIVATSSLEQREAEKRKAENSFNTGVAVNDHIGLMDRKGEGKVRFYKVDDQVVIGEGLNIGVELIPNTTDAAGEKHVPVIEVSGDEVKVSVGSVEHPMLEAHYIQFIVLETENGYQKACLAPGEKPTAVFKTSEKVLAAYEYCNLHGLWKAEA